jgi:hypothetical protein
MPNSADSSQECGGVSDFSHDEWELPLALALESISLLSRADDGEEVVGGRLWGPIQLTFFRLTDEQSEQGVRVFFLG